MQTNVQRNLWKLFFILFIFFFIFLLVSLYLRYSEIQKKRLQELCYAQETLWRGTGIFKNYETLIDATRHFINKPSLTDRDKKEFEDYLKNLIRSDKLILGFRISDKNGNKVFINSSLDPLGAKHILKKSPLTKEDFLKTLQSENMVIGRPYRLKNGTWILPLRKAIHNDSGDLSWVVTLGIDMKEFAQTFPHNQNEIFLSILLKDPSFVRIFRSHTPPKEYERFLGKPLTQKQMSHLSGGLKRSGITLEELRNKEHAKLLEFDFVDDKNNDATLYICIQYDKKYQLWSAVAMRKNQLYSAFLPILLNHLLVFFSIIVVLYFLFKRISKLEKKRFEELQYQATHDPLTNLPNRYYMIEIAQEWIESNRHFCLLFLDLDNFKNINDTMGHPTGDKLLVAVANRIKNILPQDAVLVRHGGDEFVIFCRFRQIFEIEQLAYKILETISKPYDIDDMELIISGSIGISRYPEDGKHLNELLSAADIAMYRAKELKNSFKHFSSALIEKQKRTIEIEHELHHAIARNELYLTYQPQISKDMSLHGIEALLRWYNPKLGEVSPAEFISVAEKSGMIIDIGKFVIQQALYEICSLQRARHPFQALYQCLYKTVCRAQLRTRIL